MRGLKIQSTPVLPSYQMYQDGLLIIYDGSDFGRTKIRTDNHFLCLFRHYMRLTELFEEINKM
jgi:hypothetical protein